MDYIVSFLIHWAITAFSLWLASKVFRGLKFDNGRSLVIAALLLGFANAIVWPLLFWLTLPLTILTLGGFLLVINALVLMLVAALVRGFRISGFWTAFFASIFISVLALVLANVVERFVPGPADQQMQLPTDKGAVWL
jgi:putative membrane protein